MRFESTAEGRVGVDGADRRRKLVHRIYTVEDISNLFLGHSLIIVISAFLQCLGLMLTDFNNILLQMEMNDLCMYLEQKVSCLKQIARFAFIRLG